MSKGIIIFLNGASSAGKTTIAKMIQHESDKEMYYLSMDNYQSMIGEKQLNNDYWGALNKVGIALFKTAELFSKSGMNVIIDCVLLDLPELFWYEEVMKLINNNPVLMVDVSCALKERARREKERGDRNIGQSDWQGNNMIHNIPYKLHVNTSDYTSLECVKSILGETENMIKKRGAQI